MDTVTDNNAIIEPFRLPPPEPEILRVTDAMVSEYWAWFVNRRSFCRQANKPGDGGKHNWFRPKRNDVWFWAWNRAKALTGNQRPDYNYVQELFSARVDELKLDSEFAALDDKEISRHLAGHQTVNLYAINPQTQCCKWVAIDADYKDGYSDLQKLKFELRKDHVEAVVEHSRRGGHLWIFCAEPLPARKCRIFIYNLAQQLGVRIKGYRQESEGIEIFPRQDHLRPGEMGNALRAPLGIHRKSMTRYWFEEPGTNLAAQFAYLRSVKRLTAIDLDDLTAGLSAPYEDEPKQEAPNPFGYRPFSGKEHFEILKHVAWRRKSAGNYWAQCPSCAQHGGDRSRDNLAIKIADPVKYKCWAGCDKYMIRAALGFPIRRRTYSYSIQ